MLANSPPSGADATLTLLEDNTLTFSIGDFGLSDASDTPPNNLLAVKITTVPSLGTLTLEGLNVTAGQAITKEVIESGKLVYTPVPNANGPNYSSFTFQVQDDGGTADGGVDLDQSANTITFNVTAVNDPPAGTDKTVTINEDTAYTFLTSDVGFSDASDTPPNNLLAVKITTVPSLGTLTLDSLPVTAGQAIAKNVIESGKLVYTPVANENGTNYSSFTFQVQDDGGTADGGVDLDQSANTVTFNVTAVNDAPVRTAGSPTEIVAIEDSSNPTAATLGLSTLTYGPGGGGDEASQTLTFQVTAIPSFITLFKADGSTPVSLNETLDQTAIQGLKYKTVPNANGKGDVKWTVVDNGSNTAPSSNRLTQSLSVTVTAVNDAPIGTDTTVPINEDTTYTFSASDFGLTDPNDSPQNTLGKVKIATLPFAGLLTLSGVAVSPGFEVPVAAIGNLRYRPAAEANGTAYDWFRFQVRDAGGTANGGVDLDTVERTITFDVTAVNDAPVRLSGSPLPITVDQDSQNATAVPLGLVELAYGTGGGEDETSQTLTFEVTAIPLFITLFKADGSTAVTRNTKLTSVELQRLTYKTNPNASGTGPVTWAVVDGGKNVSPNSNTLEQSLQVTVRADDTAPLAPQSPALDPNSDSGVNSDSKTTVTRPTLTVVGPQDAASLTFNLINTDATPSTITLVASRDDGTDTWRAKPVADLAVGVWSVTAKAKDSANNESPSSASLLLKIESVPASPFDLDLAAASDSSDGSIGSDSDDITKVTTPQFKGSAFGGAKVEVFATGVGGSAVSLGTASADGITGAWQLIPISSKALAHGIYDISATATDASGNTSAASSPPLKVTIDIQPPAAPSKPELLRADDSGNDNDGITNVAQPRFTGTAEPGTALSLWATDPNGVEQEVGRGTASVTGSWTIQAAGVGETSFSFTSGKWEVRARATDAAGNPSPMSQPLSVEIVVATVASPTIALASSSDLGIYNNDGVTNVKTPTFLGTAPAGTTVSVFRLPSSSSVPEMIGTVVSDKDGNWLMPFGSAVVPFTDGIYTITATATDTSGNVSDPPATLETGLTIDTQAPQLQTLAAATGPANQPVSQVDVTFDNEVFGLAAADFELSVMINGTSRTISLAGTATVRPESVGQGDDNWLIADLARLTGATGTYSLTLNQIRVAAGKSLATDRAGNPLVSSATSATWTTDTTAPKVTSLKANATPTPATTLSPWNTGVSSVDIVFDEDVTGIDPDDFTLVRDGTPVSLATAAVIGSNKSWRLNNLSDLTTTGGNYTLTLKAAGSEIVDKAGTGNLLFADAATSWRIDKTAPEATFAAVATPRATPVDSITLTFTEAVTGVERGDFMLKRDGSPIALTSVTLSPTSGTGSIYVLSGLLGFTRVAGSYELSFRNDTGTKVTDAAGNPMATNPTALTWTVDTTSPTATIVQPTPSLRTTAVTTLSVTFSKPVNGVDVGDFKLTRNDVTVPLAGASVSGSGASYTLTIPGAATTPDGTYALTLAATGSDIAATAAPNNPLVANTTTTWTMDATKPGVVLNVNRRTVSKITVRAVFSETVTGFVATNPNDVTISGGTIGNLRNGTLIGREYLFDITPTPGNPILPITLTVEAGAANDTAGNSSTASTALRIVSDTTPPTVVLTAPAVTNQSPFAVTATFSEPVTNLTTAGVVVTNGTAASVTGNGTTWTIHVTPAATGPVTVALAAGAAKDGSDNLSLASNTVQATYDNVSPTVILSSLSGDPTRANTILVAAIFNEDVTGVTAGDLTVTSGAATVVGVTGSGREYTFQVQPAADGPIGLRIVKDSATDAAGNGNTASNALAIKSDRTPPKVVSITGPVNGNVTITLTEEVRGFDISDLLLARNGQSLSLNGARLTGPSGTNNTTWTLALGTLVSVGGQYRLQIAASKAGIVDLAGNALIDDRASSSTGLIYDFTADTSPPIATFKALPSLTNTPLSTVDLTFNEPVSGVDLTDFTLTLDGVSVGRLSTLSGVSLTPTSGPSATYTIAGLAPFTGIAGRYTLQLVATGSGITDVAGNALLAAANTNWTLDLTPPTATLGPVATIVSGPISAVPVKFSEMVNGVDVADFTLTRNNATVPLVGANLVANVPGTSSFQLANLSSLTAAPGNYTLTLRDAGTGIVDAAGNLLATPVSVSWQNAGSQSSNSLTGVFGPVTPNPRTVPVVGVELSFSSAVTGVGPEDFKLSRTTNGTKTSIPTTGLIVTGSGVSWSVRGLADLTQTPGEYVLRLAAADSGIMTSTGEGLSAAVVTYWKTLPTPAAPTALITLDTPPSVGAAFNSVTITFNKDVSGVKLSDLVLLRGTVPVSLVGTSLTQLSPSTYRLSGLAPIVAGATSYELQLVAGGSGIVGTDGSALQSNASVTWVQGLVSLRAAFLGLDGSTTAPVAATKLRFSESVRGVDVNDFVLTVDKGDGFGPQVVSLRGVSVTGSGTSWTVTNLGGLQASSGRYVLRLTKANGDIRTSAGRNLAEDATVEWTLM
ncbi:MAG: hypothetical protein K8S94_06670 [Planctomycetia bacterium]|nr:hypothetical protein [Planctomycetia bacterium]